MLVIGQYKEAVTGNMSCVTGHKCCFSLVMKTYNQCLVSFSIFVIVLINWDNTLCHLILSVTILVIDKSDFCFAVSQKLLRSQIS